MWQWSPMVTPPSPERRPSRTSFSPVPPLIRTYSRRFQTCSKINSWVSLKIEARQNIAFYPWWIIYVHILSYIYITLIQWWSPFSTDTWSIPPGGTHHKRPQKTHETTRSPRRPLLARTDLSALAPGRRHLKKTPMDGMWPLNGRYNMVLPHQNWGYNLGITWYNWYNMV